MTSPMAWQFAMPKVMLAGQGLTEVVRQLDDESVETTVPPSLRLNLRVAVVTICAYAEEKRTSMISQQRWM